MAMDIVTLAAYVNAGQGLVVLRAMHVPPIITAKFAQFVCAQNSLYLLKYVIYCSFIKIVILLPIVLEMGSVIMMEAVPAIQLLLEPHVKSAHCTIIQI